MIKARKPLHFAKKTRTPVAFRQNVQVLLPYDRKRYQHYLRSDADSYTKWYGVSFQLASEAQNISRGVNFGLTKFIDNYEALFQQVVARFDDESAWVVTHDYDGVWLPNEEQTLPALRALFARNRVPNSFKGALLLKKQEIFTFTRDFLSYPTGIFSREKSLYYDIDFSHSKLPFIIKISGHLNVDLLSTNPTLLREVVKEHCSAAFTIKSYRGTAL